MIIYLASFPRSGNTLCRQLIKHYFDRVSTSVYREQSSLTGNQHFEIVVDQENNPYRVLIDNSDPILTPEFRQELASSEEIFFVKTHEAPFDTYFDGEYVFRIVRHPAAALWSYYNYLHKFEGETVSLELVITGKSPDPQHSHLQWSKYTEKWLSKEKTLADKCVKIKYEDLLHNEEILINKVQQLTRLPLKNARDTFPEFEHFHAKFPTFYRSGQLNEWKNQLSDEQLMLIYEYHGQAMALEGYDFDFAPPPYSVDYASRIHLAKLGMTDVASMPKVENAGQVIEADHLRVQVMFNGVKVPADSYYGPWYTDLIEQCEGHHEPQEEFVFDQLVKNAPAGAKMMELGSFWAFYSTWFLSHVQDSQAILVEPIPDHIVTSLATLSLNKCRANVEFGAVGTRDSIFEKIYIGGAQIPNFEPPLLSVDGLMTLYAIDHLYILHSDIQGAETSMLEGAANSLKNHKIDYVVISTHSNKIHLACLQTLQDFNYHIVAEHDIYESYTYDGLIVARSEQAQGPEKIAIHKRTAAEWTWEEAKKAWADKDIHLAKHHEVLNSDELRSAFTALRKDYDEAVEQEKSLEVEITRLQQEVTQLETTMSVRELDHRARAEKLYDLAKQLDHLENTVNQLRKRKIAKVMRRLGKPLI